MSLFPLNDKKKGLVNKLRRFFDGAAHAPRDIQQYRWMTFLPADAKARLYTPDLDAALSGADVYRPVREALAARREDALNRPLDADLSIFLADATIHPQPHDIPMDFVVTEAGVHAAGGAPLVRLDAEACRARAQRLCEERGLPRAKRVSNDSYSLPVCYAPNFPGYFGESEGEKK